ncbi:MAG: ASKHA domain-containing protein [bacterium]
MERFEVLFLPDNKRIRVDRGENLLSVALSAGVFVNSVCGGVGVCGKCKLIIRRGDVECDPSALISGPPEDSAKVVLACKSHVMSNLVVEVPFESKVKSFRVLTEGLEEEILKGEADPLVQKRTFKLSPPSLVDNSSDQQRLIRAMRKVADDMSIRIDLAELRKLPKILRQNDWKVTTTFADTGGVIDILRIQSEDGNNLGLAIDVGTTTVVVCLVDLRRMETIDIRSSYNGQMIYGEDVITRIIHASEMGGLGGLHRAIVDTINNLVEDLIRANGVNPDDIDAIVCAGNTVMTHFLLSLDPSHIRREPYTPVANFFPIIRADRIGINVNRHAVLYCMPAVSGYVGGDITAGVISCGIADSDNLSILIDIGTNGEIVLGNRDWLISCSCSAGPAFEGSGIRFGMRATQGAIERIDVDPQGELAFRISTIGGVKPRGICGSGLIDALAVLLETGTIDRTGKINPDLPTPRVRRGDEGLEFVLVWGRDTEGGNDIVLTNADIENLIRSKAAVYAGLRILLRHVGMELPQVERIFIGGGFGNYINMERAIQIGLLPDVERERFRFIGNSSLAGAKAALLSKSARDKAEEIASKMTYIELSVDSAFMDEYVSAMFLPHTNLDLFPSVKSPSYVDSNLLS